MILNINRHFSPSAVAQVFVSSMSSSLFLSFGEPAYPPCILARGLVIFEMFHVMRFIGNHSRSWRTVIPLESHVCRVIVGCVIDRAKIQITY